MLRQLERELGQAGRLVRCEWLVGLAVCVLMGSASGLPRTILAVPVGDHLNHLVHRSRHLSELSLQLAKRVPPASFSTTPIKEHLEHPQRHRSGASRGARTAPRCRRRGRSPSRSTEARPCGRCGGGRAPSAAQTPCPGFAASVPAQRLVGWWHCARSAQSFVPRSEDGSGGCNTKSLVMVQ